jgi:hypothetical protein
MNEHPFKTPAPNSKQSAEGLLNALQEHPCLRGHFEALLAIVNQEGGKCQTADEAEFSLIEEMRKLGKEALTEWARKGHTKAVELARATTLGIKSHSKKN